LIKLEELVQLAKEVDEGDPIDWGHFDVTKDQAYNLVASGMLEHYSNCEPSERELMLLAVATHLAVENFVLHSKNLELKEVNMRL